MTLSERNRLEQEKISHAYAVRKIQELLRNRKGGNPAAIISKE
jgi:hypothetical protein